jgi:signal transduction histidine kinase
MRRLGRPRAFDAALALAAVLALSVEMSLSSDISGPLWANLLLAPAIALPLAWRRAHSLAAAVATFGSAVLLSVTLTPIADFVTGMPIAVLTVYGAAAYAGRRAALAVLTAVPLIVLVVAIAADDLTFPGLLFPTSVIAAAWGAGRAVRSASALGAELRARNAELERERSERERRAVAEERARIARELHDVVAHSVSVMVVQAGAARKVLDREPDRTIAALEVVEGSGREALIEMRRLLGILREDGEDAARAPQPSLSRIGTLVERARTAGLPVELRVEGRAGPLAPGIDLTAFRVVQEALTNAIKHAGPARASVTVRWSEAALELEVSDNGAGPRKANGAGPAAPGAGHGLLGMRERVGLYGGELHAGRGRGGGFVVRARLPR